MSQSKRNSNNHTGQTSGLGAVHQQTGPEILFNRRTNWEHPQEVLHYGITEAILHGETALFEVLPGVGKSRSITKIASGIKMPVTILTNLSDNYEQYSGWGAEDGVEVHKLPVSDLCPTLKGGHTDDPIAQEAHEAYRNGWPVSMIHREFDVPCGRGEETCPYRARVDEIDPDGPDPLVGHFTQGYNPPYVNDRVVVIDEDPFDHYITEIKNPIEKAEEYLNTLDEFPFKSARRPEPGEGQKRRKALDRLEAEGLAPSNHQDSVGDFHAKAPLVAYAIIAAERMDNDWLVVELPRSRTAAFYGQPGKGSIHLFEPPDLSDAKAVIGLDATPCLSKWEGILGDEFNHFRLFNDTQRNQYLRECGFEFIQLNNYVWPVSGGRVSLGRSEAYLREVPRKHGHHPDLITSKAMLGIKDNHEGLEDRGLGDLWNRQMHYGKLRGRNKLKDSKLLVVLGSPSRNDGDIQLPAALLGECAIPAKDPNGDRLKGYYLDYQSRVANEILETTRRGGVFQAAMRAGREESVEATVYIATGMVPEWLDTKKAGKPNLGGHHDACTKLRSDGMKQVIEALRGADGMAPSELYDQVDLSKDQAKEHRRGLHQRGLIQKEGRTRGATYYDIWLESLNIAGEVDLSLSGDFRLKNSIRGFPPNRTRPDPVIPRRDPPADPERRYPEWMRDVQRRARQKKFDNKLEDRWRSSQ